MSQTNRQLAPLEDRGPLKVLFLSTSLPVGGAEVLLANLVRRMDRQRFLPEIGCLKQLGPLGEELAREVPAASMFLCHKFDLRVLPRLVRHFYKQRIDAVVTVGAGDKMFWGRIAARLARVPVIATALHSTGWPDSVGRLNRLLTPITDAFIGVAEGHGRHLIQSEGFPPEKVRVIPNGVDTERFRPNREARATLRSQLGIPSGAPVCGVVAALRPEKNHALFLQAAVGIRATNPDTRFLIVGDGPQRARLESLSAEFGISDAVAFLGTRRDVAELLSALDVFLLTSHNEANPVSILEALAVGVPVVATRVGSVPTTVIDGQTGFLAEPGNAKQVAEYVLRILNTPGLAVTLGANGRANVRQHWSLDRMVHGYEKLIEEIYRSKTTVRRTGADSARGEPLSVVG